MIVPVLNFTSREPVSSRRKEDLGRILNKSSWGSRLISCRKQIMKHICHFIIRLYRLHRISWCILRLGCNSHADLLMITHEWNNIIVKHRLIMNSFELMLKSFNVSNRVDIPAFSCVLAQLRSLLRPGGGKLARNRFRGVFITAVIHFNREESAFNPKSWDFSMRFLKASDTGN